MEDGKLRRSGRLTGGRETEHGPASESASGLDRPAPGDERPAAHPHPAWRQFYDAVREGAEKRRGRK
jgi:hypothetical protein